MKTIAFLGLGEMGIRMATNLQQAGYPLRVYNRSAERCQKLIDGGATACPTQREAAENADVVISMVSNDEASRAIWLDDKNGALWGLQKDGIAIECSTLSITWCKELASIIKGQGAKFLDAPVVGSRPQAQAQQLIHLVGGEGQELQQVYEILAVSAGAIHYVGETGAGMSMKLAVNALFGIQTAALAEVLGVLQRAGISKDNAVSLLNELPTTSPALKGVGALIANENYAPLFPINLVEKDFGYFEQLATSLDADIPCGASTRHVYQQAKSSGYGEDNITGVVRLYMPELVANHG